MRQEHNYNFCYPFKIRIPILTNSRVVIEHMEILDEQFTICGHRHECFEILYCLCGSQELQIQDQLLTIHAGEYVVIPPDMWHQTLHSGDNPKTFFCFNFALDFKKDLERKNGVPEEYRFYAKLDEVLQCKTYLTGMDQHDSKKVVEQILSEFNEKKAGWFSLMRNACLVFWISIFRNIINAPQEADELQSDSNLSIEILRYISGHYQENIKLEDIAAAVHLSLRHACRVFETYLV